MTAKGFDPAALHDSLEVLEAKPIAWCSSQARSKVQVHIGHILGCEASYILLEQSRPENPKFAAGCFKLMF